MSLRAIARTLVVFVALAVGSTATRAAEDAAGFISDLGKRAVTVLTSNSSEADRERQFRALFDEGQTCFFDEAAEVLGYSLADVCFNGPAERLNSTAVSQPALYVCSLAALEQLRTTEAQAEQECVAAAGLRC